MTITENQIFNLMDTNGRRKDVVDALQGYLTILDGILRKQKLPWGRLPGSAAEFEFYRQAIALSPDVFQKHGKYDALAAQLDKMPELKKAIAERDVYWLSQNYSKYPKEWREGFDKDVEARARHYTSTLVKLGFTDDQRQITDVGDVLLGNIPLRRDGIEVLLPLNDTNIVYLRQLLKLRIFDGKCERHYSPFCMALYALLRKERISQDAFCAIVQGLSPYHNIIDYDAFMDECEKNGVIQDDSVHMPEDMDSSIEISECDFKRFFKNGKSEATIMVYYGFYQALVHFIQAKSDGRLDKLLTFYESHKGILNKAFGYGSNLFQNKRGNRPTVEDFLKNENTDLFTFQDGLRSLNSILYRRFEQSKTMDAIREYSDTTIRIFKATGLISFDNGYVELVCRDLCQCVFDKDVIKSRIMGGASKEDGSYSPYWMNHSLSEILSYSDEQLADILNDVRIEFSGASLAEIPQIVQRRRKTDFEKVIADRYPEERVKYLLGLFSDRSNDSAIKEAVCQDAAVPTIYEYVVGLAWYYFSDKTIDLLQSFNLTLSADFEPLTHAGGGMGDIVIYEPDKVIMLEATLMNANSQKRGEWEPVLRHSVNLKIEVETSDSREVTTFFIADSFDANTINIWKAISSVPLQSSTDKSKYTDSVIIMPVNNAELMRLMERKSEYNQIIRQVRSLFLKDVQRQSFNRNWRDEFISQL